MPTQLYAAKAGLQGSSYLYSLDPATGARTSHGPIGYAVTGLAEHPSSGVLYGVTSPNSNASPKNLITIDKTTGDGTVVGALSTKTITDIAFKSDGTLYGYSQGDKKVCTINLGTGAVSLLGASGLVGSFGGGLSFDSSDVLYSFTAGSDGNLYTVNLGTGAFTSIGVMDDSALTDPGDSVGAAAFDASDGLWAIQSGDFLATLDVGTLVWTEIAGLFGTDWDAIAWGDGPDAPGSAAPIDFAEYTLYTARAGIQGTTDLYQIDETTGVVASVGAAGVALTGMTQDPTTGTLYGMASAASDLLDNHLVVIDVESGDATDVGEVGNGFDAHPDIAFTSTGRIYSWNKSENQLCEIDKTTAEENLIGASNTITSTAGCGLSIDSGDVLYICPKRVQGNLYTLDLVTGAATSLGAMDNSDLPASTGMAVVAGAFDQDDVFWAVTSFGTSGDPVYLATLDVATRVWTYVATISSPTNWWDALAWFGSGVAAPAPTGPVARFFQGYEQRWIFTDLDHVITAMPEHFYTGRRIAKTVNQATVLEGGVWPDEFRINEIVGDGYPRLAQSNRFVHVFERTGGTPPWRIREAGILMSPQDEGDADQPLTHFTAYDPWKYLEARPCMDSDGELPPSEGFEYLNIPGNEIALDLLLNTITEEGTVHIDAGEDWGGTAFYEGTIETTDQLVFTAGYGESVSDAWNRLCDTGTLDLVLTAIWDPENRPGYTHELSVYSLAGSEKPSAVFAWGMLNRSVTRIDRMHDGTPGAFFNKVQYHAGQGGPPVPAAGPLVNALSVAAFGSYWAQQFFPSQTSTDETAGAVYAMAQQALELAKQGRRSITLQPTPERAPRPYDEYTIADRVPIYAPRTLRVTAAGYQRIEGMGIEVDDDGTARIGSLLCTPDFREE